MLQEEPNGQSEATHNKTTSTPTDNTTSSLEPLMSTISPPSALPQFIASPVMLSPHQHDSQLSRNLPPLAGPPTISQPLTGPPTISQPLTGPPTISQPLTGPPTISQPLTGPPTISQPLTGPPTISQPLTGPPTISQPLTGPPTISQPLPGPPTISQPLTGPPTISQPLTGPPTISQPLAGPPPTPPSVPRPSSVPPASLMTSNNLQITSPVTSQPQAPTSCSDRCSTSTAGAPAVDINAPPGQDQSGWIGWFKGTVSSVGSRVAEKAKNSMDSVITTLDPQMKELIHSGGDIDVLVASDKQVKVGAIREAFQAVFGRATVNGLASQATEVAAQPVGIEAAMKAAEERINNVRSSGSVHPQQPIVAVENFIMELTPGSWYQLGLLLLDDPWHDILLHTFTQTIPIPPQFIAKLKEATPPDYVYKETGFSITIGQVVGHALQVQHSEWQHALYGVPARDAIVLSGRILAGMYKLKLPLLQYEAASQT